ncbi:MAG: xylulokinase [Caldilineaceae bacterium]
MSYLIGIDVSTTATKALIIDTQGNLVATAATEYPFETPRPLWSEQDPQLWWDGAVNSIRAAIQQAAIDPAAVLAIGLTGQMHGLVLLNQAGQVLRPAILWNDQRTAAECKQIRNALGRTALIQETGNDALTGFTAPKIAWVRNHEPELYQQVRHVLLPKDYVRFRLTNEYAMDKADGAGTILFDLRKRGWSDKMLEALHIPQAWMPPTFEGPEITGRLSAEAASATGLRPGTLVMAGGGDQAAQAVGVGAVHEGIVALTLGTSGVIFASVDSPFIEPEGRLHAFCHAVPNTWHLMGVMLSAAGSLRWYRDTVAPGSEFDELVAHAASVPVGSEGLFFLPYLTGERTPHPDPLARAAFVGLTVRHGQAHMTRAVLEGVAYGLRDSFELMKSVGLSSIQQVRVSGGGARSSLWRQILADVLGAELVTVNTSEGAAFGAALLAGVGGQVWRDVATACHEVIQVTGSTQPIAEHSAIYNQYYSSYDNLYAALKPTFDRVGGL